MAGWRERIDRTSNWAITAAAAMLSLSLSTPTSHHGVLLFAMLLVFLLLVIEARRYRFYDVYRDRVRTLERHYLGPSLRGETSLDRSWRDALAADLHYPRFHVSWLGAMSRRLRRNYIWLYLILLLAWLLKISSPLLQPDEAPHVGWRAPFDNMVASAAAGPLPGWVAMGFVTLFYGVLVWMLLQRNNGDDPDDGEVHL